MTLLVIADRRSPVTMPGFHDGRAPRNKGRRYPADPPTVEEIIAVMRTAGSGADGARLRALIVILWRAGLRIGEALDLAETDLDASRGAVLVRRGKGGRRREVGMDRWGWSQLEPWIAIRRQLPVGALLCVIRGVTAGRHWESSSARKQLARTAGHANFGVTSIYLQGIDSSEIIHTVHSRPAPVIPATAGLGSML
jgi:integrase